MQIKAYDFSFSNMFWTACVGVACLVAGGFLL